MLGLPSAATPTLKRMADNSIRVADLRVSKLTIWFMRYVYPVAMLLTLIQRRRNQSVAASSAAKLGEDAARIVVASQKNAKTLRWLTYVIAGATIVNTGFIIYSALKR